VPEPAFEKLRTAANMPLRPETRAMFMKAVDAFEPRAPRSSSTTASFR
jgi:hypothetical protein